MQPHVGLKAAVTIGALAVAAVHIWLPSIRTDAITVALLVAAVLPWLQPIFKSVKLPGGMEFVLQEIKQEVKNATGAAESAQHKADLAVSGLGRSYSESRTLQSETVTNERLVALAREYVDIRKTRPRGGARTQAMTAIVRAMIEVASSMPNLDVLPLLRSSDAGQRLAGYSYLYADPNAHYLEALVSSVTTLEDQPFGQYWGLQAIGRNLGGRVERSDTDSVLRKLTEFAEQVPPGSDRDYEARKLLAQLQTLV
jgi:hypothetical protein